MNDENITPEQIDASLREVGEDPLAFWSEFLAGMALRLALEAARGTDVTEGRARYARLFAHWKSLRDSSPKPR